MAMVYSLVHAASLSWELAHPCKFWVLSWGYLGLMCAPEPPSLKLGEAVLLSAAVCTPTALHCGRQWQEGP